MPQVAVGDGHAVTDPNGQYGFRIGVMHKCGHPSSLSYGSRRSAEEDRALQEAQLCFQCQNDIITNLAPGDGKWIKAFKTRL